MKKLILSLLALSMFVAVGYSEESATEFNGTSDTQSEELGQKASRSTAWNDVIGIEENGVFKITADEAALKADFEATLKRE